MLGRISRFTQDFKASHQFSFSWWSKPVASSWGMPQDFRVSVNFFSKLVPPKTFFDLQESHPYKEQISKLDMAKTISEGWMVPGVSAESNTESHTVQLYVYTYKMTTCDVIPVCMCVCVCVCGHTYMCLSYIYLYHNIYVS